MTQPVAKRILTEGNALTGFSRVIQVVSTNTSDESGRINAALAQTALSGSRKVVKLVGDFTILSTLVIPSDTTLDTTDAKILLGGATGIRMIRNSGSAPVATGTGSATAGSTTLTTAVSASVGQIVTIAGADASGTTAHTATVTAVGSGTLTLSVAVKTTVSGAAVKVFTRDSNIRVIGGGVFDRGSVSAGATGPDAMMTYWRHVDGLEVDITPRSTSGKYAISAASYTNGRFRLRNGSCHSDGCHIMGPAVNTHIEEITGSYGDDTFAITANDWTAYGDSSGDVKNVTIGRINSVSTAASLVKVLAGAGCHVDNVRNIGIIDGTALLHSVWVGADTGQLSTTGGSYGTIDLGAVTGSPAQNWLAVKGSTSIATLRAVVTATLSGSSNRQIVRMFEGGTIDTLDLKFDVNAGSSTGITDGIKFVSTTYTVNTLRIELARWLAGTGSGDVPFRFESGTVNHAVFPAVAGSDSAKNSFLVNWGSSGTLKTVTFLSGFLSGWRGLVFRSVTGTLDINVGQVRLSASNRALDLRAGQSNVRMSGPIFDTLANEAISANGGNIDVWGEYSAVSTALLHKAASETIRAHGLGVSCDVSKLTKTAGDIAYNSNAALSCGAGAVICDGANWKHLFTAATY